MVKLQRHPTITIVQELIPALEQYMVANGIETPTQLAHVAFTQLVATDPVSAQVEAGLHRAVKRLERAMWDEFRVAIELIRMNVDEMVKKLHAEVTGAAEIPIPPGTMAPPLSGGLAQ